jgi:hypothetical protein
MRGKRRHFYNSTAFLDSKIDTAIFLPRLRMHPRSRCRFPHPNSLRTFVESSLTLALIMRHWSEAADKVAAQRLLIDAITVSASIPDESEKARAFLLLSINCDQVEESRKSELLLSSIKSLNAVNKPTTPRDQTPYQEYVRSMDGTGHRLNRGFKALTTKDENAAIALVTQVHKSDLRTFALIGILAGLTDLIAIAEG